jgi:hypothetical protein
MEYQRLGLKSENEKTVINNIRNDENVKEIIPKAMP